MEYERSIFRVHERLLSHPKFKKISWCCFYFYGFCTFFTLTIFLYGNIALGNGGGCVKNAFELYKNSPIRITENNNNTLIRNLEKDAEYGKIYNDQKSSNNATNQKFYKEQIRDEKYMKGDLINFVFMPTDLISPTEVLKQNQEEILNPADYNQTKSYLNMTFTTERAVFMLYDKQNGQDWFTTKHTILIDQRCYSSISSIANFLDYEDLVILDIINTFSSDSIFLQNHFTQEIWFWSQKELSYLAGGNYIPIYSKISILLYLIIG